MHERALFLGPLAALMLGCSSQPLPKQTVKVSPTPSASVIAESAPLPKAPSRLRLPRTVFPLRYDATLRLSPSSPSFEGEIGMDLSISQPTRVIWLHAEELVAEEASVVSEGTKRAAKILTHENGLLGFAFDSDLAVGQAQLSIRYRGKVRDNDDHGVFMERHERNNYIFTQFESISARQVFPCIDDPAVKVPWQLTLRVPETDVALSNTPILSEEKKEDGQKVVRFAQTKPLPSYLVAFAVGPFDFVDAGVAGAGKIPVRIAVPRGEQKKAAYAAKTTPPLLGMLEEYVGIAYPYEKLDVVAVPKTSTFGAMENPGLITYASSGMLAIASDETTMFQRGFISTMAHELAHQWFGNYVTMDFWNDIWLNESFATWMGSKIVERFSPSWSEDARRTNQSGFVMVDDGLVTARKIRQEIHSEDDILNAFDGITYSKGGAVLRMFEVYAGPEKFQRGVRRYLSEHAYGNATAADFLSALSAETDAAIGPAFATFLDQPGVPVVSATLSCEKGKPPAVKLSQSRYLPMGSTGSAEQRWQIPVCMHVGGGAEARVCTLMKEPTAEVSFPELKACPEWVSLKEGGNGYFRADLGKPMLDVLLSKGKKSLSVPERLSLLSDAQALVESGRLTHADVLAFAPMLMSEPNPLLEQRAVDIAFGVREAFLPQGMEKQYASYVVRTFGKRADSIGYAMKPGESEEITMLRSMLTMLVARRGHEPKMIATMRDAAMRFLRDPASVPVDLAAPALFITARESGDKAFFDQVLTKLKTESDARRHGVLVDAFNSFQDPALVDASLGLLLAPDMDPRETMFMLAQSDPMLHRSLDFLDKNWDAIAKRAPSEAFGYAPAFYERLCDEEGKEKLRKLFTTKGKDLVGAPRALAQSLESIDLCIKQRKAHEPSLRAFLAKY